MELETKPCLVLLTCADRDEARSIARTLVAERLAACCTIVGDVESVYRWNGAVEESREIQVMAKTTAERFAELERRVLELHSYDTPEIIALPIVRGSERYMRWIEENTGP